MGSALQSCCGQSKQQSSLQYKKYVSNPVIQKQKEQKIIVQKKAPIQFTQLDILKILGQMIKVQKQMAVSDYKIQGILGIGSFGTVYLAQLKSNINYGKNQKYAIKRIAKQLLIQKSLMANVIEQRDILAMESKFLVSLNVAFQDAWYLYLVMDYAIGGDTYALIKSGSFKFQIYKNLGESAVRFISACVLEGLEFLHKNQYIYRDLKPENVLLFEDGYIKLTDFGLAKKNIAGRKNQTISGTEYYLAPEMILCKGYGKQIDIWAFGVYLYELSNYQPPFEAEQITKANFQQACLQAQKNRTWINPNISPELKDLINSLLKFDPNQRIGIKQGWKQVKNHPFYKQFNWKQLQDGTMESPLKKLIDMFPPSLKPYKDQEPRQTESNQQNFQVEGWTLVKKKTI